MTAVSTRPLLIHELGSLSKPGWRVKAFAGRPVTDADIEDAQEWGQRLVVTGYQDLVSLLRRAPLGKEERAEVARWSSRYGIRFFESAGLDYVYDGEQQRSEMYQWAIAHASGFEFRGTVRSFDNKYYSKAAATGPVGLREPYHNEEFAFLQGFASRGLKIPITGAYTIADWSFDEYHDTETSLLGSAGARQARQAAGRRSFVLDVAKNLIRPNLAALITLGATWIQVDEPAASTSPAELDLFAESFNTSVAGLDAKFSTHLCFSDYDLFFPAIEALTGCTQFAVGFANYDTRALGTSMAARPGYRALKKFRDLPDQPALGLGVLDVHTDFIESPELVRDRILHAVDVFGDPARIHVMPDCGLRTRSWEIAYGKLSSMVRGTELAKDQLGLT